MFKVMAMAGFFAMLFILSGGFQIAWATIQYVSPTGTDMSACTQASPCSLETAFTDSSIVKPGDTVYLEGGIYSASQSCNSTYTGYDYCITVSGNSTSRITFTNYEYTDSSGNPHSETAIIQGATRIQAAYVSVQGSPTNAITSPGLVFEGPQSVSGDDVVDVMYSHDVTVDHVEIRDSSWHAGLYQYAGYNIDVTNSYVHDNGTSADTNHSTDQGIYWDCAGDTTQCTNSLPSGAVGGLIANNVADHNVASGIQLFSGSSNSYPTKVTVIENTVVNNGGYGMELYGSANSVVNNISSFNGYVNGSGCDTQLRIGSGTNHTVDTNIFWDPTACRQGVSNLSGQTVTNSVIQDPLFVSCAGSSTNCITTSKDYRTENGSPAIDAGNTNSSYKLSPDIVGITRGSPPDLGAYEYKKN